MMIQKKYVAGTLLAAMVALSACSNTGTSASGSETAPGASTAVSTESSQTAASGDGTAALPAEAQFRDEEAYLEHLIPAEYVEIGEYKGIEVSVNKPEVTEEEIDDMVAYFQESVPAVPVTGRDTSQEGDIVNVDYSGRIKSDDTVFEGGTATGVTLTIGGAGYIPGFAEGMAGHKIGETFEEEVTFPEVYSNNPDLAGVEVIFTVTINSIMETPELTDDNIAELALSAFGLEGINSIRDLRDYIKNQINTYNEDQAGYEAMNLLEEQLIQNCKFTEQLPERVVARYEYLVNRQFAYQLYQYQMSGYMNMTLEQLMESAMTAEGFTGTPEEYVRNKAEDQVRMWLAFFVIAEKENLMPTDAQVAEEVAKTIAANGLTTEEEYNEAAGFRLKETVRESLIGDAVEVFLKENAKIDYQTDAGTDTSANE